MNKMAGSNFSREGERSSGDEQDFKRNQKEPKENRQSYGEISLSQDSDLLELEKKYNQYSRRLQREKKKNPDAPLGTFNDTGYKKTLLGEIIENGSVDVDAIHKAIELYHGKVDDAVFENAVRVVKDYVQTGGMVIELKNMVRKSELPNKGDLLKQMDGLETADDVKQFMEQSEDVQGLVQRSMSPEEPKKDMSSSNLDELAAWSHEDLDAQSNAEALGSVEDSGDDAEVLSESDEVLDYIDRQIGDQVRIRRSSGAVQDGWSVVGFNDDTGRWMVERQMGDDKMLVKEIAPANLDELNPVIDVQDELGDDAADTIEDLGQLAEAVTIDDGDDQDEYEQQRENIEHENIDKESARQLLEKLETPEEKEARVLRELQELREKESRNTEGIVLLEELDPIEGFDRRAFIQNLKEAHSLDEVVSAVRADDVLQSKLAEVFSVISRGVVGGGVEKTNIERVSVSDQVADVGSFDELFALLDDLGEIEGSRGKLNADQLKLVINMVRTGEVDVTKVTRTAGLRDKVRELLRNS